MDTQPTTKNRPTPFTSYKLRLTAAASLRSVVSRAAVAALADPFNADNVVENPSFTKARDTGSGELISVTLYAHPVDGQWIASSDWTLDAGPCIGDAELPARKHYRHATRLGAIAAVLKD